LIGSDTVNLEANETGVVGKRIRDIFDQLTVDPSLNPLALGPNVVLVPVVIF
jgi:hypothetical protein